MDKKNSLVQELQTRLQQSQNDKKVLQKSIEQLNECYQIKIDILESTLEQYGHRIEELLQWKKEGIEQELSSSEKYEQQNSRLHGIITQLETAFKDEILKLQQQIKLKDEQIYKVMTEKEELYSKSQESEHKIDQLVREHTKEIEELKKQLTILKQQIESVEGSRINKQLMISKEYSTIFEDNKNEESSTQNELTLKEITNPKVIKQKHQSHTDEQTRIKQLAYRSPLGPIIRN